ncbi:hypothetical protein [Desulfobacter vibrioformis]|uniref:hypothetical protein n=1 Tax=Desulfobacter vibrioformis TaxID=34031 RepID=UPI0012EC9499|nr:hypothetical protein [Desulfobacter vibrioformis]
MNRLTLLALLMLVSSAVLFSGCVVPADSYYSDPYYQSNVTVVPALPYTVILYEQPYYNYHGYYYFYNSQRWYYSRTKGGNWIALPRTHWPSDTRWKGRHFHNDHRDHKYDGHDQPPSKDPKYRPPKAAPRGNDKHRQKKDPHPRDPRYNNKYQQKKDSRYKAPRREGSRQLQKDPVQKDKRRDEMDQRRQSPGKRAMDPRHPGHNKMKQEQDNRNQRKTHPPQNKKHQDGKTRTEEETRSSEPEFKRR